MASIRDYIGRMIHPSPPQGWATLLMPRTRFDYKREVGRGTKNSIVMATVLWIARNFPEAILRVYEENQDGDLSAISGHDMVRLIERPNDYYSGALLWMATLIDFVVDGNAYWLKVYSKAGTEVVELWWIPSNLIEPKGTADAYVDHYEYRPDPNKTEPVKLDPKEVVHFRHGLDPDNVRKGLSPLGSVLREIFTDDEAANFLASLMRNLGVPGLVINPKNDQRIAPGQAEQIKESVKEKTTGDKRGEPIVFSGAVDVTKISFSPKDLLMTDLRRVPEERISAVTGIPAVVANLGAGLDRSTYNNMTEARASAVENGLVPLYRLLAAELTIQLLPDFDEAENHRALFDTSDIRVLQEDLNAKEQRLRGGLLAGGLMRSDYRAGLNYETTPGDDVYLLSASVVEVPVGAANLVPVTGTSAMDAASFKEYKSRAEQRRFTSMMIRESSRLASAFADDLQSVFQDIGADVAERIGAGVQGKALGDFPLSWDLLLNNPELIDKSIPLDQYDQMLTEVYTAHYQDIAAETAKAVSDYYGLDVNVGTMLQDPRMLDVIRSGGTRQGLVDLKKQTRDAIYSALGDAREAGEGPAVALKRIKDYVEGANLYNGIYDRRYKRELERGASESFAREAATEAANRYRAETIARTETKHAQNASSLEAYEIADFETVTCHDGDGCGWLRHDDPDLANGKVVTIAEARDHTLAHPRCLRSFSPKDMKDVPAAPSKTPDLAEYDFKTVDEVSRGSRSAYMYKLLNDALRFMGDKQFRAWQDYVKQGHADINGYLRGQKAKYPKSAIRALDSAVKLGATDDPLLVYRGITSTSINKAITDWSADRTEPLMLKDDGFVSTSADSSTADRFAADISPNQAVMLEIELEPQTNYIPGNSREAEMILGRGAQFLVRDVTIGPNGGLTARVRYMGSDPKPLSDYKGMPAEEPKVTEAELEADAGKYPERFVWQEGDLRIIHPEWA